LVRNSEERVVLDEEGPNGQGHSLSPADLTPVRVLFVEFHPHPDKDERVARVMGLLRRAGFSTRKERLRAFTAEKETPAISRGRLPTVR
jgi:hypothetical protein